MTDDDDFGIGPVGEPFEVERSQEIPESQQENEDEEDTDTDDGAVKDKNHNGC